MRGYRLSRKARADLKSIYVYTEERFGRDQAEAYAQGIETKLHLLAERPDIGRHRTEIGGRTCSFPHESHVIYYEAEDGIVLILRILHAAQDPIRHLAE